MKKFYAKKGEIPKIGEIWLPVGDKRHLSMLHIFDVEKVKRFIPSEIDIISFFGKTLGAVYMTHMGPESTLEYHELVIMPALVNVNGNRGFWVSHIYVDQEESYIGGRNMCLPKQMANFDWTMYEPPGEIHISQDNKPLFTIKYGKPFGKFRIFLGGPTVSMLPGGNKIIWCMNRFKADYGLSIVRYEVSPESPIAKDMADIGLGRPLFGFIGKNMKGFNGERTQVAAYLPDRI